jgi:peptide/nickel transport system permease protein
MGTLVGNPQQEAVSGEVGLNRERVANFGAYLRRNPSLGVGLVLVGALLSIGIIGPFFVDTRKSAPAEVLPDQHPSREYPLGSDDQGRDLLAVVVAGLPLTIKVGFIAGIVGLGIGTILGFTAGYLGGPVDTVFRTLADVLLTVPGLVVLITFAATIKGTIGIGTMALIVASLAWMWPTRTIRSQVLSLRERGYIQLAKISGMNTFEIIFFELMPPIVLLVALFVGLMFISIGLDEVANPRRRRATT